MRALAVLALAMPLVHATPADFVGADSPVAPATSLAYLLGRIDAGALQTHIEWLADPRREGRGLGTAGLVATADYLADQLAAAGVGPLGRGRLRDAYFQGVALREVRTPGGELTIRVPGAAGRAYRAGVDCVLPQIAPQTLSGPLVFAGFGIREPALDHDDFRGLDVRGKVVLFIGGVPPGADWQTPELVDRYANPRVQDRYDARIELLKRLGARAAIAIEDQLAARLTAGKEPRDAYFLEAADAPAPSDPPLVRVTPEAVQWLLPAGKAIPGARAAIRISGLLQRSSSRNVLGVLLGSDPDLRREAVMIGAHMDHLGLRGGVLHPGADDNASGTSALLEIAKALAASPVRPRRSLVFAFWTAEEAGQFGSQHYVRHPLWPLRRTVAYLNLDMIAHPWTVDEIRRLVTAENSSGAGELLARATPANFAEPGLAKWAPELGAALATAGAVTGMVLHLDRGDGMDGGSDYRSFARRGLPWIRFFGNFFPGYHEPEDTPDRLDPAQVQRMARLALATAWSLAEVSARPRRLPSAGAGSK
jgi:hypothetical protein